MNDEPMTSDEVAIWEQRVRRFGLDPARHGRGQRRVVTASSIDELKAMINAPVLAEQRPTIAPSGADARRARNLTLREAIIDHLAGVAEITDPATHDEISRRFPEFGIEVINALDRRVTASDPLIVNAQHTAANFGTVTIEPGGYIEISVPCTFQAVRLIKTGPTTPAVGADIVITGTPGTPGDPGGPNKKGDDGSLGTSGQCDCCGGIATAAGTIGGRGGDGTTGTNGGRGGPGQKGPNVLINIDQLGSTITLLNIGGRGGDGGRGQAGGAGGRGGPGGSEKQCMAEWSNGGPGGPGGNGSDGAGGGPAGPGGPGGSSWVLFRTPNGSEVIVTNGQADPGTPGKGGDVGCRGDGGASGGRGASTGPPGSDGTNPGKPGDTASPGARGFVAVNPPQAT